VSLPKPHLDLLSKLCLFLNEFAVHKEVTMMDYANFAIVFASNILKAPEETLESTLKYGSVNRLVETMIAYSKELFDATNEVEVQRPAGNWVFDMQKFCRTLKQQEEREEEKRRREKEELAKPLEPSVPGNSGSTSASSSTSPVKPPQRAGETEQSGNQKAKRSISTAGKLTSLQRKSVGGKITKVLKSKEKS